MAQRAERDSNYLYFLSCQIISVGWLGCPFLFYYRIKAKRNLRYDSIDMYGFRVN